MGDPVRLSFDSGVALLTLASPARRNAVSLEVLDRFTARLAEVRRAPTTRALVITGEPDFCSGADLNALGELLQRTGGEGLPAMHRAIRSLYDGFLAVDALPIPTIAAIRGVAVGGGLGLALLCDIRVAATDARLGATFARIGIHSGLGITAMLPRLAGYETAARMLFTGRTVTGEQAQRLGLVGDSVPADEVLPRALELAHAIAAAAPLAVREMKRTLRLAAGRDRLDLEPVLELESLAQALLGQTADAEEGIRAFLERRDPVFRGR